jgi:hypothetical protein
VQAAQHAERCEQQRFKEAVMFISTELTCLPPRTAVRASTMAVASCTVAAAAMAASIPRLTSKSRPIQAGMPISAIITEWMSDSRGPAVSSI